MTKILRAVGATFAYKMRGTSRPHAKFTGDFGSAIEVIRISDRSLLSVFAKNLEPCNFRLLQHNRPLPEVAQRYSLPRGRGWLGELLAATIGSTDPVTCLID